jgi:CBS domain-containing protein
LKPGYDRFVSVTPHETTVGDVMVRRPKTLPADVTVTDARKAFENASVKMLLLVEGDRFRGAVTAIPAHADPEELALTFVDESPVTVTADMRASEALARLDHKPNGRMIVLDEERLAGLVCLTSDGERFCGSPSASA